MGLHLRRMTANTMTNWAQWAVTPTPNQALHGVILCSTMTLQLIAALIDIIVGSQRNYMKLGANQQKDGRYDGWTVGLENKGSVAVTKSAHSNPITNVHVSQNTANNLKLDGYPTTRGKRYQEIRTCYLAYHDHQHIRRIFFLYVQ